jgi:hypothetical protein
VLRNTLRRRMRTAVAAWRAYVQHQQTKHRKAAAAAHHARVAACAHAMCGWALCMQVR